MDSYCTRISESAFSGHWCVYLHSCGRYCVFIIKRGLHSLERASANLGSSREQVFVDESRRPIRNILYCTVSVSRKMDCAVMSAASSRT